MPLRIGDILRTPAQNSYIYRRRIAYPCAKFKGNQDQRTTIVCKRYCYETLIIDKRVNGIGNAHCNQLIFWRNRRLNTSQLRLLPLMVQNPEFYVSN